ncbi:MAG: 1,4-dihydroxy-2-naphthoate octaprenyltransferase [Crocinitomicaceae bacterium]|nr:1,4-dihydroxy-2-naphthoate octaprenyltransferase [Crocinitomicaceae bacterium]
MSKSKAWISAMRLRTLPLSLSGIVAGSGVAHYHGFWDSTIFSLALLTTILFQILSNFANDLGDGTKGTDNQERIGPERAVQSGVISQKEMKGAVIFTAILSFISAGSLIYFGAQNMPTKVIWMYIGLAIACVIAAITYTVGKKAYGYHGMGDLMVLLFFGGVSVLGVYSLYAKEFSASNINLALFVGLLSTAVLNLNNMRDYQNDAKSGKNTIVVKMGPNNAKFYHIILIIGAIVSLALFIDGMDNNLLYIGGIPALFLFVHLYTIMKIQQPKDFDPELKKVALTTFGTCLALFGMFVWL